MRKPQFQSPHQSFKAELFEHIEQMLEDHSMDRFDGMEALMEVMSELARTARYRDTALAKLYDQAKSEAKRELLSKLQS